MERAENDVFWVSSMPLKLLIMVQTFSESISFFNQILNVVLLSVMKGNY